jgi:hypothetical protein
MTRHIGGSSRVLDPAPPGSGVLRCAHHDPRSRPHRPSPSVLCQLSSDGLLLWLSEECWARGLIHLAELLDDLLTKRQAEQPAPQVDAELEALLPF